MALILSIETSTSVFSAALHESGELLIDKEEHTPFSSAARLTPAINTLFNETGLDKSSLHAVSVSAGPGSYTGLRIGVATAKGICYALDIPLITVDSLHILADSLEERPDSANLCPMIDARRMEVYACLLTSSMEELEPTRPLVVEETSFADHLTRNKIVFFGNGSNKCREVIHHPGAIFIDGIYPRARAMGQRVFRKFESANFADVRHFEPAYLKEFVAKTKKS